MEIVTITVDELILKLKGVIKDELNNLPKKRKNPYTAKEVLEMFNISRPTLHRWGKKGILEKIDVGGRIYFTVDSVENHYYARG